MAIIYNTAILAISLPSVCFLSTGNLKRAHRCAIGGMVEVSKPVWILTPLDTATVCGDYKAQRLQLYKTRLTQCFRYVT